MNDTMPDTAREALARWDAGETVWTAEMGGLGPGYEQAIHIVAFEIIRELLTHEPIDWSKATKEHEDEWQQFLDEIERVVMQRIAGMGITGAQWGAAQNLALRTTRVGWAKALRELPTSRHMLVSQTWPRLETPHE